MCIKDNPSGLQDPKPARKTRTKTRRPKFLSLRLSLSPETPTHSPETPTHSPENPTHQGSGPKKPDLDLFPLRPESPDAYAGVAARFFDSDGGATIAGLLAAGGGGGESDSPAAAGSSDTYRISSSPSEGSLTYACAAAAQDRGRFLVRAAMRWRGREEERWVSLSEVVEKKEEEVTSCDAGAGYAGCGRAQGLSLKLDYQEVMDTWSDRAPLYVGEGEGPQTVPDVNDDFLGNDRCNNVWMDGWGSTAGIGGLWSVPECDESSIIKMEDEEANKEKMRMMGQREASVLRYKEKRHNRLFSKRIRYEVRKLNAEKRPRMKGRFVKRS